MVNSIDQLDLNKKYSYADYLTWQLGEYVELIRGKVFRMTPTPGRRHQKISYQLGGVFYTFFGKGPCEVYPAPFDVRLLPKKQNQNTYTVVQPDLCIVCDSAKLDDKGCMGAPDLIVEILSPSTSQKDLGEKYDLYEEAGVREYWVIDPIHQLLNQYALEEGQFGMRKVHLADDQLHLAIFPEIEINLADVFAE